MTARNQPNIVLRSLRWESLPPLIITKLFQKMCECALWCFVSEPTQRSERDCMIDYLLGCPVKSRSTSDFYIWSLDLLVLPPLFLLRPLKIWFLVRLKIQLVSNPLISSLNSKMVARLLHEFTRCVNFGVVNALTAIWLENIIFAFVYISVIWPFSF